MQKPADFEAGGAFSRAGRKPKLKEAAQAALVGVELDEGEDCLVIAGGFDLKAKRRGAQVGGDGKPGFARPSPRWPGARPGSQRP